MPWNWNLNSLWYSTVCTFRVILGDHVYVYGITAPTQWDCARLFRYHLSGPEYSLRTASSDNFDRIGGTTNYGSVLQWRGRDHHQIMAISISSAQPMMPYLLVHTLDWITAGGNVCVCMYDLSTTHDTTTSFFSFYSRWSLFEGGRKTGIPGAE